MAEPVLQTHGLTKSFGAIRATSDVSLTLMPGEIHALIGPNGAGKSTLVKQIAGGLRPDAGRITFMGRDVSRLGTVERARAGLGRSFQISAVIPEYTVLENVGLALHGRAGGVFRTLRPWHRREGLIEEAHRHAARAHLGERLDVRADALAHGERRRLELAMALALEPRAFLLDEPMAGMGTEGAAEMTAILGALRHEAPILLIEHDMDAVFALADRISVLVYGEVVATGTVDEIRAHAEVRRAYLGEEDAA